MFSPPNGPNYLGRYVGISMGVPAKTSAGSGSPANCNYPWMYGVLYLQASSVVSTGHTSN